MSPARAPPWRGVSPRNKDPIEPRGCGRRFVPSGSNKPELNRRTGTAESGPRTFATQIQI
jgi:hypothetical protein